MDLNSDLGEGYGRWALGDDPGMLEVVTSANVACGFHAGDPATIDRTVRTAVERGVAVGAQVSYPDLVGFGRREIDVPPADLTADVLYQIGALEAFARAAGSRVRYVKPHGALYNRIARDPVQAAAVVEAIRRYDPALPLLTLPGSAAMEAAREAGVPAVGVYAVRSVWLGLPMSSIHTSAAAAFTCSEGCGGAMEIVWIVPVSVL